MNNTWLTIRNRLFKWSGVFLDATSFHSHRSQEPAVKFFKFSGRHARRRLPTRLPRVNVL